MAATSSPYFAERGRIEHTKGFGWLQSFISIAHEQHSRGLLMSHHNNPPIYSSVGMMGSPFGSFLGSIMNEARIDVIEIQREFFAMGSPGHFLRPKPNAAVFGSRISGLSLPSFINRSGLKVKGSGYAFSSCKMALRLSECHYDHLGTLRSPVICNNESTFR